MIRGLCTFCSAPLPNFLHSPEPEQVNRGIHLGYLSKGNEFRIPVDYFGFHFAFYGVTGSGKTRGAMQLAIQAEKNGIKLLILDVEGEWKNIIPFLDGKTEYYSTDRNLKINPYDLNDYGLVRALLKETIFKGIEVDYQDISPQMNYVLDKCIQSSNSIPELIDNVTSYEESNLPFKLTNLDRTKTALLVRLEPYRTNPALNEIFYTESSSINLQKLSERNLVIDLHPLESKVAYQVELRLIYNAIAIAYLKEALQREPTNVISNLFIADEAQLLAPKILKKVVVTDTWTTTEFATRLRKRGQSLVIISQSPSNIEDDIRKNCQNNFIFRLQDAKDVELIARSTGYNWYTALDYFTQELTNLKQREALIKTPLVNEPFIITIADLNLKSLSANELENYSPKAPIGSLVDEEIPRETNFDNEEKLFFDSITKFPFITTRERRHLLRWDDKIYAKIVQRLHKENKIEKVKVKTGKGAPRILYQIPGSNPSVRHEFYVNWIVQQLRSKGIECIVSRDGPDIQIPSLNTAINVETGNSDIQGNIKIALCNFSRVIVCSDDEELISKVSEEIGQEGVSCSLCWEIPNLFG